MHRLRSDSLAAVVTIAATLSAAGCDPFHTEFEAVEPALTYRARELSEAPASVESLRVLDWNVKFGGARLDFFFDCFGDRVLMTREEVVANLESVAAEIRALDPDIVLLQEIDIASKRAAYVDELQWLLDHTALNYAVYASQWRADYVPSDGLGPVDSGNAVLSRWPLAEGVRIALAESTEQGALTRYFYLRRNVLRVRVDLPGRAPLWVVTTHTDAYGKDGTKRQHIDRFRAVLDELRDAGALAIGGGDLNTLPPGSVKVSGFPDSVCTNEDFIADDYSAERDWLVALYDSYASAIPLADYDADNSRYFGHTVDGRGFWNRTLDYLFTNGTWVAGSGVVHQDESGGGLPTMPLSDHAPLTATLALP